jgi:hypothetical protein
MFIPIGAASNALSYLQSLLAMGTSGAGGANGTDPISSLLDGQSGSDPTTGASPPAAASTGSTAGSNQSTFDTGMMAALISLQSQLQNQSASGAAPQDPSQLFAKLDTDGNGQISQSEFETALGNDGVDKSSADALFSKLDANGDGSISQSELTQAQHAGGHHHHMHAGGGGQAGGTSGQSTIDALLSSASASGAQTQTATNSDGSTTTTISYADGSTVEMTTPAASTDGSGNSGTSATGQNTANLLEQLIQLQAQLLSAAPPTLSAVA